MNEATNEQPADQTNMVQLTADIVSAFASSPNNTISAGDLPGLISQVHTALSNAASPAEPEVQLEPAVPIRSSVKHDYIVCLEDGKKLKMLKRHLMTSYGMTPDQYRAKWGLPADYPMVAPDYAETRRKLAKSIGLGRHRTRNTSGSDASNSSGSDNSNDTNNDGGGKGRGGRKATADSQPTAKRGRKPKASADAAPKKRGRPKGSKNKPKAANA